jgi:hypothetical protein
MASKKKTGILNKVPLPDTFFSIKHQLQPIVSVNLSAPSAILIYLLTLGGFVACWVFYSQPNPPVTETIIQSDWQKEGFVCKPLQKDPHYGLMHTYDECKTNLQEASTTTTSLLNATDAWIYKPFGGSEVEASYPKLPSTLPKIFTAIKSSSGLEDGACFQGTIISSTGKSLQLNSKIAASTESITQSSWQKTGYTCTPTQGDSMYGVEYTYDECLTQVQNPGNASVILSGNRYSYYPFGTSKGKFRVTDDENTYLRSTDPNNSPHEIFQSCRNNWATGALENKGDFTDGGMPPVPPQHIANHFYTCILALSQISGVCETLKNNAPFQCTKSSAGSDCVTQSTAIKVFNALNEKHPICDHFKDNAPFQCTRQIVTYKSELERLSLSIANTQLLFGTLASFAVFIFYKLKKKDLVSPVNNPVSDNKKMVGV